MSFRVSVIMAEYSTDSAYIRQAIDSVLSQTYSDFEFIIVDDSGTNRVERITKEYDDKRIRIIKNAKNMGFVYSLNNGIRHARGEYIIRMDTDDIITPDRFEKLIDYIEKHPEYAVVSSRTAQFTDREELGIIGTQGEKSKKEVMQGDVPVHAAAIIRKADIEEIGLYKNYLRAEDLVLWCELLLAGKRLYMLEDVLYRYRVNPHDYKKRTIRHRKAEIKARLIYYPKLGATPMDYLKIAKSIAAGLAPIWLVRFYHNRFVLKGHKS